jgi:hypothetical protein
VGALVSLRASVVPAAPPVVVTASVYRFDSARRSYRLVTTARRTTVAGRAAIAWRPTTPGRYYLRLTTPASAQFAAGTSPSYRWVVR